MNNLGKVLKKILIFRSFTDSEIESLIPICEVFEYESGERIITQGEPSRYIYCLVEGYVDVRLDSNDEKDIHITEIKQGDIFGEAALFLDVKRTAHVIAMDTMRIIKIEQKDLVDFINTVPQAGVKILVYVIYSLLNKLKNTNTELVFEKDTRVSENDLEKLNKFLPRLTLNEYLDS